MALYVVVLVPEGRFHLEFVDFFTRQLSVVVLPMRPHAVVWS